MPKRRGRGEGAVFFHASKKRWIVRWQGLERSAKSKPEAQVKLRELQLNGAGKRRTVRATVTVSSYLEVWLEQIRSNRSPSTWANYETTIRMHICPMMGGLLLEKLSAAHVEEWLARLRVGQRTKQNAFTILKAALGRAVKQGVIPRNPCENVERPRHEAAEVSPFTPEQMRAILKVVEGHRLEAIFHIAFRLGLRQAELFGLKWKDIDFSSRTLNVVQQNAEVRGKVVEKAPKTKGSQRPIPLDDACLDALQERRRIAFREGFLGENDWVFPGKEGQAIARSTFSRRTWAMVLKKAGVEYRGMHQCRHTAATIMLNSKVSPGVVAKILGHSKPSTTLNIYARYIREAGEDAIATISKAIGG